VDDVFELYWKHFRTQLRTWWDRLDAGEVESIQGKRENLIALLEAKYGYSQVECENIVRQRIDEFEQRHRNKLGSFIQARRRYVLLVPKTHSVTVTSLEKIEVGGRNH
jgi:hypothetical protein